MDHQTNFKGDVNEPIQNEPQLTHSQDLRYTYWQTNEPDHYPNMRLSEADLEEIAYYLALAQSLDWHSSSQTSSDSLSHQGMTIRYS